MGCWGPFGDPYGVLLTRWGFIGGQWQVFLGLFGSQLGSIKYLVDY